MPWLRASGTVCWFVLHSQRRTIGPLSCQDQPRKHMDLPCRKRRIPEDTEVAEEIRRYRKEKDTCFIAPLHHVLAVKPVLREEVSCVLHPAGTFSGKR